MHESENCKGGIERSDLKYGFFIKIFERCSYQICE